MGVVLGAAPGQKPTREAVLPRTEQGRPGESSHGEALLGTERRTPCCWLRLLEPWAGGQAAVQAPHARAGSWQVQTPCGKLAEASQPRNTTQQLKESTLI